METASLKLIFYVVVESAWVPMAADSPCASFTSVSIGVGVGKQLAMGVGVAN